MLWKSAKLTHVYLRHSIVGRLTFFYTLATIGLILVIALLFYPSLARLLTHFRTENGSELTIECIKLLILMILVGSVGATILGYYITRKGLSTIEKLQSVIQYLSADALNERIIINDWPNELKTLGHQFNEMLERLHSSFNQLQQFSSDLAHELRHPLQHLQQMTELALSSETISLQEQDLLVNYMDEFSKLSILIEQLLFIARTEQAQIQLNLEKIDLNSVINDVFEYFRALSDEKNITLVCEGCAQIKADPILLRRALINIVANAIESISNDGLILARVITLSTEEIAIEIKDNGLGIKDEDIPKLFQRFYQVDSSRSRPGSLGLGLPIVKSIVALHQGRIEIQSQIEIGTTVSLVFFKNLC